jgi:hypothetical protein
MKTIVNFSTANAKAFRTSANLEGKGMNHAIKAVKAVWDKPEKDPELASSIKSAKDDGLVIEDFSSAFIIKHLDGTNYCKDKVIGTTSKGEFKPKTTWTAGQVVDYVRRANRARILNASKAEKESK